MNEVDEAPSFKVSWAWQFHNTELETLDKLRGSPTPAKPKSPQSNKPPHKSYSSYQSHQPSFNNSSYYHPIKQTPHWYTVSKMYKFREIACLTQASGVRGFCIKKYQSA